MSVTQVYKRPDGELIDVIVPENQNDFPDTAQGQTGQVIACLPVEGGITRVIWDAVPEDWELVTEDGDHDGEDAYDPSDHNVDEVIAYAASLDDRDAVATILLVEKDGKDRKTLIEALADRLGEIDAVEDPEHHGDGDDNVSRETSDDAPADGDDGTDDVEGAGV